MQHVESQHALAAGCGFRARLNALANRASMGSSVRVTSTSTPSNPAPAKLAAVAVFLERAAETSDPQLDVPTDRVRCVTLHDDVGDREAAGFRTRNASDNARSLSADKLITQFEMITSTESISASLYTLVRIYSGRSKEAVRQKYGAAAETVRTE